VVRLLELMTTQCEGPGAFQRLCDVLETRHPWLGQELIAELKVCYATSDSSARCYNDFHWL